MLASVSSFGDLCVAAFPFERPTYKIYMYEATATCTSVTYISSMYKSLRLHELYEVQFPCQGTDRLIKR